MQLICGAKLVRDITWVYRGTLSKRVSVIHAVLWQRLLLMYSKKASKVGIPDDSGFSFAQVM